MRGILHPPSYYGQERWLRRMMETSRNLPENEIVVAQVEPCLAHCMITHPRDMRAPLQDPPCCHVRHSTSNVCATCVMGGLRVTGTSCGVMLCRCSIDYIPSFACTP